MSNGGSYAYYVRCQDSSGNSNTDDLTISFSVSSSVQSIITVDSTYDAGYDPEVIDDDIIDALPVNGNTWASGDSSVDPHWVVIDFGENRSIGNVTIWWAYNSYVSNTYMTSQQVVVQTWDGVSWQNSSTIEPVVFDVPSSLTSFSSVETSRLRFWQPANMGSPNYTTVMWLTEIDYGSRGSGCSLPFDEPVCGCIDSSDLLETINSWYSSQVSIAALMTNIKNWKSCN